MPRLVLGSGSFTLLYILRSPLTLYVALVAALHAPCVVFVLYCTLRSFRYVVLRFALPHATTTRSLSFYHTTTRSRVGSACRYADRSCGLHAIPAVYYVCYVAIWLICATRCAATLLRSALPVLFALPFRCFRLLHLPFTFFDSGSVIGYFYGLPTVYVILLPRTLPSRSHYLLFFRWFGWLCHFIPIAVGSSTPYHGWFTRFVTVLRCVYVCQLLVVVTLRLRLYYPRFCRAFPLAFVCTTHISPLPSSTVDSAAALQLHRACPFVAYLVLTLIPV